ncbi:MAG: M81 family peptidase [Hyphomicrobiales bacterium]|nr:MAG: M81 family peptidase [Hyphomicrobiales bacterium]
MTSKRVLFAGLFHETHCFTPDITGLADFRIERGDAVLDRRGDGSQIDGFIEVADREGWEIVPACSYTAMPSGRVDDVVWASFWADLDAIAERAGREGVDAIYLSLHGAMVTQSLDDPEGEMIARLRAMPGLADVPLFGVFDLHANFTPAMASGASGLVCYRENPHIDARESGVRAAKLLARCFRQNRVPRMVSRKLPLLWAPTGTGTADSPMRDLEAMARRIEAEEPAIWAVNVVAGFSYADVADAGVSFSLVTTDLAKADAALDLLEDRAVALRGRALVAEHDPDALLARILPIAKGPVVLVEPSDNIGGGAPGNGTGLLRALLRHPVEDAAIVIDDAEAVSALAAAPIGSVTAVAIGGRDNPFDDGPVQLDVQLVSRSDGKFDLEDINSHLAASVGRHIDMGPSVVVRHGGITILLTTRKTPPFDLGQLRSQGIIPEKMKLIVVKAAVAHRRAYDPIAAGSYTVATRGPCTNDPRLLPYSKLRRPIFPLDEIPL